MDMLLRRPRRRPCLIGLAGLSVLAFAAAPVAAQQITAAKGSVTIDLGVLNQLGTPSTPGGYYPYSQAPGYAPPAYGQSAYGQPAYAQPAYNGYNPYPTQPIGPLLYPPTQNPVSTLTVPPPPGATPYVAEQPAASASSAAVAASPPPPPSTPATPAEATNQGATTTPPAASETTGSTAAATTEQSGTGSATASTGTESTTTATGTSAVPATPPPPAVPSATEQTGTAATGGETTTATATQATGESSAASTASAATTATGATAGQTATASAGGQAAETPPAPVEGQLQIAFPKDSAEIPDAAKSELDSLADKMNANSAMRLQLLAYASGTPDTASRARRMSLSRALAVRSYLIKKGVVSTRMDVRALGDNVQGEPADRVDILPKTS